MLDSLEIGDAAGPVAHGLHGVEGGGAGLGHGRQGFLLELGDPLDGGHQVRDQVKPTLVLGLHIGPFRIHAFFQRHKAVVAGHGAEADEEQEGEQRPECVFHRVSLVVEVRIT